MEEKPDSIIPNGSPISKLLSRLDGVKKKGNDFVALCPVHGDEKPSLSLKETSDGKVLLKCFVGCSVKSIVDELHLQMSDLFPSKQESFSTSFEKTKNRLETLFTLENLAQDKKLPIEFLKGLGLFQKTKGVVSIPYKLEDGNLAKRQRLRKALKAKEGSFWEKGKGDTILYGLWKLEDAKKLKKLICVEGESDCWTLWYHGFPCLGFPGADMAKKLQARYLEEVATLYLLQEPDQGGDTFILGLRHRLKEIGFLGEVLIIRLPEEVKDPNELHQKNPEQFKKVFETALKQAIPLKDIPFEEQKVQADPEPISPLDEEKSPILQALEEDEYGDAKLFAKMVEKRKLYDHTALKWLSYKNGVWVKDEEKKTRKEAISLLTDAYLNYSLKLDDDIVRIFKKLQQNENKKTEEMFTKTISSKTTLRDTLRKRAKFLTNRRRIDNVLDLATGEISTLTRYFDKDPDKLNLANGIFDFKKMKFCPHSEEERFYKQAPVFYEPNATCEKWLVWLNQIFNQDQNLIQFIQQFVGVCLTGVTDVQVLFFCYGKGANGKTTFFSVLKELLGDYYVTIPIESLLVKQRDSTVDYQLAKLHGARLVVASEIPEGRRLQESQVKDLTGGEPVNARNPHEKPFTFDPSHKLCLFGNHKPIIRGTDYGIWRRIHLVPFTVTIPKSKQTPRSQLMEEFKQELSGILNWAIEGYKNYFENNGLTTSQAIELATKEYQEESDILGSYLNERCEIKPIFYCFAKDVFADYLKWSQENNDTPMFRNSKNFITALRERDFQTKIGHGNKTEILGLKLKDG